VGDGWYDWLVPQRECCNTSHETRAETYRQQWWYIRYFFLQNWSHPADEETTHLFSLTHNNVSPALSPSSQICCSFNSTWVTQLHEQAFTILTGRSMNSGLLLAVKPAMSGPNKISRPNMIITCQFVQNSRPLFNVRKHKRPNIQYKLHSKISKQYN